MHWWKSCQSTHAVGGRTSFISCQLLRPVYDISLRSASALQSRGVPQGEIKNRPASCLQGVVCGGTGAFFSHAARARARTVIHMSTTVSTPHTRVARPPLSFFLHSSIDRSTLARSTSPHSSHTQAHLARHAHTHTHTHTHTRTAAAVRPSLPPRPATDRSSLSASPCGSAGVAKPAPPTHAPRPTPRSSSCRRGRRRPTARARAGARRGGWWARRP